MNSWSDVCRQCVATVAATPAWISLVSLLATALGVFVLDIVLTIDLSSFSSYSSLHPSHGLPCQKKRSTGPSTKMDPSQPPQQLPCWSDALDSAKQSSPSPAVEPAELFMSVVVPAFNEEERLTDMLDEAVTYLENTYPSRANAAVEIKPARKRKTDNGHAKNGPATAPEAGRGWEIVIVSDGSTDRTEEVAFGFAKERKLEPGAFRVVSLTRNRGKGGAVTHGMRHVRGQYVVFADADGASKFEDLGKLVAACSDVEDAEGRGVAVGSRAHMVGSEAVVKRSKLRNFLMHSFHLILWLMTPPKTATVKDTQCGFKLFSRAALPYIVPYMHSEGWIFDVEMLMLAEFAHIPVAEVPVGWKEVGGSKLNVLRDSIGMAWGLALLRASWSLGVYRQR
ncbi:Dolichyl-phosphate beta-glucosyltransferase [Penicillium chermesinum]|uniref:dolichyl-phosphate beta-glucosyltransferase n=1 Tax=Penicillium chermesinum TaxID=63820 RepID=A0A9W9P6W4_9EURO|nr:Dolichyl-phosphate beta-glucosyltransferase [Penicillium chermesinum]KAJ5238919.1 Dolichyl-phosphate beta-glucosyltransferase [Penicillium chermesinum]